METKHSIMKKILLLAITSVLLTSCSGDDSPSPVTLPPQINLVKLKQTIYAGGQVEEKVDFEYTNGFLNTANFFTPENELTFYTKHNYNNNNLLISTVTYTAQNVEIARREFSYDNQGRIYHINHEEGEYSTDTDYIFNPDNTITATTTYNGGGTSVKTYHINSNGLVYKEVGTNTYEITFEGFNPISAVSNFGSPKTFEYDEVHPMIAITSGQYGSYKPNAVLSGNSLRDAENSTATKYLIKQIAGSEITESEYTFNLNGTPSQRSVYRNNAMISKLEYIY